MSHSEELLAESQLDKAAQEIAQAVRSADEVLHKMTPDTAVDGLRAYVKNMNDYAKASSEFVGELKQSELFGHLQNVYGFNEDDLKFQGARNKLLDFTRENPDFPFQFELKLKSGGQDVLRALDDLNCSLHDLSHDISSAEQYNARNLFYKADSPAGCDDGLCSLREIDPEYEALRLRMAYMEIEGLADRRDLSPEEMLDKYTHYLEVYRMTISKFSVLQRREDESVGENRNQDMFDEIVQGRTHREAGIPPRVLPDGGGHFLEVVRDYIGQQVSDIEAIQPPAYADDEAYAQEYGAYLGSKERGYAGAIADLKTVGEIAGSAEGLRLGLRDFERISGYSIDYLEKQKNLMALEAECCIPSVRAYPAAQGVDLGASFNAQAAMSSLPAQIAPATEIASAPGFKR